MKYIVYVLYSKQYDKIYVGYTSDLEQRLLSHNKLGKKGWTIKFRPWQIIYTEVFDNKRLEMIREQELKSAQGRAFIRTLIVQ